MKLKFLVLALLAAVAAQEEHQHEHGHGMDMSTPMDMEEAPATKGNATAPEQSEHSHSTAPASHGMDMSSMNSESLNETAILITHGADPLSFYEYDYESEKNSKPGWMIMHAIGMSVSFGILLPIGERLLCAKLLQLTN